MAGAKGEFLKGYNDENHSDSDLGYVTTTKQASSNKVALDTNLTGGSASFTPSGLTIDMEVTNTTVTDTAAKLPATALTDRNSIAIRNLSSTLNIYIADDAGVTAAGATRGWIVEPDSIFSVDITDSIELYAICDAGQMVNVQVVEFA